MIAVIAAAAVSANAQTWIGGSLGFNTEKTTVDGEKLSSGTSFEIAPEVGYSLNENWDVAIKLGYTYSSEKSMTFSGYKATGNYNAFEINPYVRYTFVKAGNFFAFCDGGVAYSTGHISNIDKNLNQFSVGLNPGIGYKVSPKVSLVAHIGDLSYTYSWWDDLKNNAFNLNLTNSISFGAYVAL